jgi:hypothetical protein
MKVVLYERFQASGVHAHWYSSGKYAYVADLDVILCMGRNGTFGEEVAALSRSPVFLQEVKDLLAGKIQAEPPKETISWDPMKDHPPQPPPQFKNIRTVEVSEQTIRSVVEILETRDRLQGEATTMVAAILASTN